MQEVERLKKQIQDLQDLYETEKQRVSHQESSLRSFYIREPLVQNLWTELVILRKLLESQYKLAPSVLDLPKGRFENKNGSEKTGAMTHRERLVALQLQALQENALTVDGYLGAAKNGGIPQQQQQQQQQQIAPPPTIPGPPSDGDSSALTQQIALLQQENQRLQQENQRLQQHIAQISTAGGAAPAATGGIPPPPSDGGIPPPPTDAGGIPPPPQDGTVPAAPTAGAPAAAAGGSIPPAPVLPGFIGAGGAAAAAPAAGGATGNGLDKNGNPLPPVLPGFIAGPGQTPASASASATTQQAQKVPEKDLGPVPTKPLVKPAKKMKAFHWQHGILDQKSPIAKSSVWSQVDKKYNQILRDINFNEFEELFTSAPPKQNNKPDAQEDNKPKPALDKPQRLLDPNRHNQLSIMLSKMPSLEEQRKAFLNMDSTVLKPEMIESIHKNMFTAEDVELVRSSGLPKEKLMIPEQWILEMSKINQLAGRIECWKFKNGFDEEFLTVMKPLARLETCCNEIKKSGVLPQLLAVVLALGNHSNGGTGRGRADCFAIADLSKLFRVKSTAGTTLMDYCITIMNKQVGPNWLDTLRIELSTLSECKTTSLRQVAADAKKLVGRINLTSKLKTLVVTQNLVGDKFETIFEPFLQEAQSKVKKLDERATTALDAFAEVVAYLEPHLDPAEAAKVQSEEWFAQLEDFVSSTITLQKAAEKKKADEEKAAKQAAGFAAMKKNQGASGNPNAPQGGAAANELANGFPQLRKAQQPNSGLEPQGQGGAANELANGFPQLRKAPQPGQQQPQQGGAANELANGFPQLRKAPQPNQQQPQQGGAANELANGFPQLRKAQPNPQSQPQQQQAQQDTGFVRPQLKPTTTKTAQLQVQNVSASEFDNVKRPTAKSNVFLKAQNKQIVAQKQAPTNLPPPPEELDEDFYDNLELPPPPPSDSEE